MPVYELSVFAIAFIVAGLLIRIDRRITRLERFLNRVVARLNQIHNRREIPTLYWPHTERRKKN